MKKIVSIALVLLLIATMIPMAVFADESKATDIVDTTGKAAGDKITLGGVEYTLIDSADDVVAADGNYYLLNDITLTTYFLADKDNGNNGAADESSFVGKFNGGGHTITLDGAKSVFGKWFGGEGSLFANFTVANKDNAVFAPAKWGSPLGFYACKGGNFYNITNNVEISAAADNVGGLIGGVSGPTAPAVFENCVNNANVTGNSGVAGIVGFANSGTDATFKNCVNNGKIVSNANFGAGGIVGYTKNGNLTIEDCVNYGDVSAKMSYIGGIWGGCHNAGGNALTVRISDCVNFGTITNTSPNEKYVVGGIAGGTSRSHKFDIEIDGCVNFGDVKVEKNRASGILGGAFSSGAPKITITNCYSAGAVTTTEFDPAAFLNLEIAANEGENIYTATVVIDNCYTLGSEKLYNIGENSNNTISENVGTTTLAKVVEAANNSDAVEGTLYVKDGEVLVCDAHDYKDGVCTVCGAEDPNYVPPTPTPDPEPTPDPDPAPTSDITVYALAIALVSLAGVVAAKKKIRE